MTTKRFGLTKKQNEVFKYIKNQISKNDVAPSYEEIKLAVHLKSKNSVHEYVKQLIARGWLTNLKGRARSLRVTKAIPNKKFS